MGAPICWSPWEAQVDGYVSCRLVRAFPIVFLFCRLLCVGGGRDVVNQDSVAVDTSAHFDKSTVWKGQFGSLGEANGTDVIEKLGREIAKNLARELHDTHAEHTLSPMELAEQLVHTLQPNATKPTKQHAAADQHRDLPTSLSELVHGSHGSSVAPSAIAAAPVQAAGHSQRLSNIRHVSSGNRTPTRLQSLHAHLQADQGARSQRLTEKRLDAIASDLIQLKAVVALQKTAREQMEFTHALDMFHAVEGSGTTCIDFGVLDAKLHSPPQGSLSENEFLQVCNKAGVFEKIDIDGSGKIDAAEYRKACYDKVLDGDMIHLGSALRSYGTVSSAVLLAMLIALA
jgi:hypothetical protein